MSFKFKLDKKVSEYSGGGKPFVQPYHAYKATIKSIEERGDWINLLVETEDAKSGQFDAISIYTKDGAGAIKAAGSITNRVVRSNPSLTGKDDVDEVDVSKLVGYKIGVTYIPSKTKESGYKEEGKFCEPSNFPITVDEVDTWEVDTVAYEAWRAKFWAKDDGAKPATPTETPASTLPVDTELPF
jgi:hypothetical protein